MRKINCFLSLFLLIFISCEKLQLDCDQDNPEIKLIYPQDNPKLSSGLPLCIKIVVTDNSLIKRLTWEIVNQENSEQVLTKQEDLSLCRHYVVDETINLKSDLTGNFLFKISAVDGSGNTTKLSFPFSRQN